MAIRPVDIRKFEGKTSNVYEAIIVAAKKARQINDERKIEFKALSETVPQSPSDDDSEDFNNPQQQSVSLAFEKRPKPHEEGLMQLIEGKLEFYYKEKE